MTRCLLSRARLAWLCGLLLAGCATAQPSPVPVDAPSAALTENISAAAPADLYLTERPPAIVRAPWWRWVQGHVLYPTQQALDVTHVARALTDRPRPAIDLVEGYVVNSSFFTNREMAVLTPERMRRGAVASLEEPQPPFVCEGLRAPGREPGFFVVDARGNHYRFTVDVQGHPEVGTTAEVVTGKLLHALGYNVLPRDSYLLYPTDVRVGGRSVPDLPEHAPATAAEVERLLAPRKDAQGRVRVVATKLPDESTVVGCFSYKRYQHFAALRALRVAYGWLNNSDAGELQTLMLWDGHIARGYLVDFGSSLDADVRRGVKAPEAPYDPERWSPAESNVAFDQMTPAEARWMARRIAAFSAEQLTAAIAAARMSRPDAAGALLAMLQARQAAIRRRYVEGEKTVAPVAAPVPVPPAAAPPATPPPPSAPPAASLVAPVAPSSPTAPAQPPPAMEPGPAAPAPATPAPSSPATTPMTPEAAPSPVVAPSPSTPSTPSTATPPAAPSSP